MPTDKITSAQLKAIFVEAEISGLQKVADELNTDLNLYGLDTVQRKAHFFAQVRQEAGPALQAQEESLNYSPNGLINTFHYYSIHKDEAMVDGYVKDTATKKITRSAQQEKIANKVYANRIGNGDVASGDGWKFRGRGFIQLTGRENYLNIGKQYKLLYPSNPVDFGVSPEKVKEFPFSVRSAVTFWILHGLHKLADKGVTSADVDRITAVINLKTESYQERQNNFNKSLHVFQS